MKNILALLLLTSCSSTMMRDPRDVPKFAPAGYKSIGIVHYLNQGADHLINWRREDAFKKMHEACGGDYEILKESFSDPGISSINPNGFGGYSVSKGSQRVYLQFECNNKTAKN